MKTKVLSALAITALVLSFSNCKKKSSDPSPASTPTQTIQTVTDPKTIISSHPWTISSINWGGELAQSCNKDDTYTFKTDGTGTLDKGANKCDFSETKITSLTWTILGTDKFVLKLGTQSADTNTIVSTSDSEFQFKSKPTFGTSEVTTLVK